MTDKQYRVLLYNLVYVRTLCASIIHHAKRTTLGRKLSTLRTRRRGARLAPLLNSGRRRGRRAVPMHKRCRSPQSGWFDWCRPHGCPVRCAALGFRDLDAPSASTCRAREQCSRAYAGFTVLSACTCVLLRQGKTVRDTLAWRCKTAWRGREHVSHWWRCGASRRRQSRRGGKHVDVRFRTRRRCRLRGSRLRRSSLYAGDRAHCLFRCRSRHDRVRITGDAPRWIHRGRATWSGPRCGAQSCWFRRGGTSGSLVPQVTLRRG